MNHSIQAASESLPGVFGLVLQAPFSREEIATAAISAALGLAQGDLDSRDEIIRAAAKRPQKELAQKKMDTSVSILKQELYNLGDCGGEKDKLDKAFDLLEMIENYNERSPTTDPVLNGRWDFVLDVEADIGTAVVKDIISGESPIKFVLDLKQPYMIIDNNSIINIYVQTKVLSILPVNLKLTTNLIPDPTDPTGTIFLEKFQGVELFGRKFPVPEDWQRSRPLEFSYLDETMLIARGNGAEPHYLKRD